MTRREFMVKLLAAQPGTDWAALKPPFDVVAVFERKGRVPVKGTINGFPFRSSLMNTGDGHMMVVNAEMRKGAQCQAGDTVHVVMEFDGDKRTVELPADLNQIIKRNSNTREAWAALSFSHQKEHVRVIEQAKRPETRKKRVTALVDALKKKTAAKK